MKICGKCNLEKTEYRKKASKTDGLDNWCKDCRRIDDKRIYDKNLEKNRKDGAESKSKARQRNREYLYDFLLLNPCVECGEPDPIVLELDHLDRSIKSDEVSRLLNDSSIERLQLEIDKCQVLCANCHRRKTAQQLNYYKYSRMAELAYASDSLEL